MCGIAGKLYYDAEKRMSSDLLQGMMDVIAHRGPDGEGKYLSGPVGLGHRRLAIIDLNSGAQPMFNEDKSVAIVFNGEIYNFKDLRQELIQKGHAFSSNSDTETIIHAYEEYGVDCLERLQGMFAFALWDSRTATLFLARDRVGIKPLYYYDTGHSLVFGSEIKSLLVDPEVKREIDPSSIDRFLSYLYLPGNKTLLKGLNKLEPGHHMIVRKGKVTCRQYWDLSYNPESRWESLDQAADELSVLLKNSVRGYMISDVPVGFLLSGGVDSTALLSCAVEETNKQISTFTIGFSGNEFADERPYARLAAERFGTDHHEISISAGQFRDFLPKYIWHMEEPVCEPPAVALYYVSKLASEHVKVVLSGEGGDEAFGGYPNYRNLLLFERGKSASRPFQSLVQHAIGGLAKLNKLERAQKYVPLVKMPLQKYYYTKTSSPFSYFNRNKSSIYTNQFRASLNGDGGSAVTDELFAHVKGAHLLNQMLYVDTKTWLPDDLLIKADKITMANSLELRVPMLDHKVLEFAASLPTAYKVKGITTKRILKKAMSARVPEEIIKRKKTGFPVPYEKWLQGELGPYVRDVLLDDAAVNRGYFKKKGIESLLKENATQPSLAREVFSLLVLELWHGQFA